MKLKTLFETPMIKDLFNALEDGFYFSNGEGETLWNNDASEKILGSKREELRGKSVWELEGRGIMNPSITKMVLEAGESVSSVQTTQQGRQYFVSGYIIPWEQEKLVVVLSRDITKDMQTTKQLEQAEILLRFYSQEVRGIRLQRNKEKGEQFTGKSKAFTNTVDLLKKVAAVDTTVLLSGETGVGKSSAAGKIHEFSDRHEGPFISINCGSIPESLMESELFGFKKGSFTGAYQGGKVGLVELADRGTLFLDEIGEVPMHIQSKLLQLVQHKTYLPIGETAPRTVDARIITATNKNLKEMISRQTFREDLYYRLNVLPVNLPALRHREEDIYPLLQVALDRFNSQHAKQRRFTSTVLKLLQDYSWPGNIRELENVVERMVITAEEDDMNTSDLPDDIIQEVSGGRYSFADGANRTLAEAVEELEQKMILEAEAKHSSTRRAAAALGLSQSSYMRRKKKYIVN